MMVHGLTQRSLGRASWASSAGASRPLPRRLRGVRRPRRTASGSTASRPRLGVTVHRRVCKVTVHRRVIRGIMDWRIMVTGLRMPSRSHRYTNLCSALEKMRCQGHQVTASNHKGLGRTLQLNLQFHLRFPILVLLPPWLVDQGLLLRLDILYSYLLISRLDRTFRHAVQLLRLRLTQKRVRQGHTLSRWSLKRSLFTLTSTSIRSLYGMSPPLILCPFTQSLSRSRPCLCRARRPGRLRTVRFWSQGQSQRRNRSTPMRRPRLKFRLPNSRSLCH